MKREKRAIGQVAAGLGALALVASVVSPGCSGSASSVGHGPRAPEPEASSPSPLASEAPPPAPAAPLDPTDTRPVLADPRFAEAQRLAEANDFAGAARSLEAAMARGTSPPASPAEAPRLRYQLGRLLSLGHDPARAAGEFLAASQAAWPLSPYAALSAGQELLKAGRPDEARRACEQVPDDVPPAAAARLCQADALEALAQGGAPAQAGEAARLLRRYLEAAPKGARWAEASVRLARALLVPGASPDDAEKALSLARRVLIEQPAGPQASRAGDLEREALSQLPPDRRAKLEGVRRDDELSRLVALGDAGKAGEAERGMADLEARLSDAERKGDLGCRLAQAHAKLLARTGDKKKRKSLSADRWQQAVDRCSGEARVVSLWQAGQAAQALGKPAEAMARFEQLEREAPKHRLADDARLKGALAAQLLGDEARFSSMLERMADVYPDGDMTTEGLFRLALHRMGKSDWAGAAAPLEASIKLRPRERDYFAAGRAPYFHARMLAQTGERAKALDEYQKVIEGHPLSYYMALAHARLAEADPKAAEQALARAMSREDSGPPQVPDLPQLRSPGFARAIELLRQGDLDSARGELSALGLGPSSPPEVQWLIASLYAQAGASVAAHAIPRGRVSDWLDHYPTGAWRKAWELAYPRPWLEVVGREAQKSGIPSSLTYAVMREESVFDPQATSGAPAYGLMQFTLDTGKHVGKKLGLAINEAALKTPAVSIALGCRFLADLRARYPACPALAIPSYNAGPGKTNAWLSQRPFDDLDLFVERIPFEETRNYTKRVLKSYAAYLFLYEPQAISEAIRLPARAQAKPAEPSAGEPEPTAQAEGE